jgi:hypothetical protein
MGGPGSGNFYHWWRPTKKTLVEDCLSLDANRWMREGILKAGVHQSGYWRWTYGSGGSFRVDYDVMTLDPARYTMRLHYTWQWTATGQVDSADYAVNLTTTRPRFGGVRWWFRCPLLVNGRGCYRRVGKLYLPPRARYFGCRECHGLTYRSTQEHDKRVDVYRRHPELLDAMLKDPEANLGKLSLAVKAIGKTADDIARLERRR